MRTLEQAWPSLRPGPRRHPQEDLAPDRGRRTRRVRNRARNGGGRATKPTTWRRPIHRRRHSPPRRNTLQPPRGQPQIHAPRQARVRAARPAPGVREGMGRGGARGQGGSRYARAAPLQSQGVDRRREPTRQGDRANRPATELPGGPNAARQLLRGLDEHRRCPRQHVGRRTVSDTDGAALRTNRRPHKRR